MIERTWPYGTVKDVEILRVDHAGPYTVVAASEKGGEREGFILVRPRGEIDAEVGQVGTITFTRGGPTGGYWHWRPEAVGAGSGVAP